MSEDKLSTFLPVSVETRAEFCKCSPAFPAICLLFEPRFILQAVLSAHIDFHLITFGRLCYVSTNQLTTFF